MIQLEEMSGLRVKTASHRPFSVEELLEPRWKSYCRVFKRCREKLSEPAVHALRVESRRLLSTLALMVTIAPRAMEVALERELRDRLKALSRLRDTQVQIDTLEKMHRHARELAPFRKWLKSREGRLIKRCQRELADAKLGKSTRRMEQLIHALREQTGRGHSRSNLQTRMIQATDEAFQSVMTRYRSAGPRDIAKLHRIRLSFKKFRYMAEVVAKVVPGISDRQLSTMQAFQKRMGNIQDLEVLLARLKKFEAKFDLDEGFWTAFRQRLLRRRARLVRRFFASADRLTSLWPVQPKAPGVTRRIIKLNLHAHAQPQNSSAKKLRQRIWRALAESADHK
jgi:CHAD domain-containing protein